jgi:hypothetical protein
MARALALGAVSSKTNPVLDFWFVLGGAIVDLAALTWQLYDLSTGTPVSVTTGTVDVVTVGGSGRLGVGHYVAGWTATGNVGRHRMVWTATPVGGSATLYQYDFDVLTAGLSQKGPAYCLLADIRDEGFASSGASGISDLRALTLIRKVSVFIERWTRRFFEPRYRTITLDGGRGPSQWVQDPIVALDSAYLDTELVDPTCYKVFNRHIAEGLTNPDDRDNPRVTFTRITRVLSEVNTYDRPFYNRQVWWPGPRNVQLAGLFGYTDPDPDYPPGSTPEMIRHVAMLLFAREMLPLSDGDGRDDAANAYRVDSLRTRDQSVTYGADRMQLTTKGANEFTGDPAIDDIIAMYMAPPFIGSP